MLNKNLEKQIKGAIESFNKIRKPEAIARLLEFKDKKFLVKFTGHMCFSCGVYDYFEDLMWELRDLGIETKIESYKNFINYFKVKYQIFNQVKIMYQLPQIPYSYNSLEPWIDAKTMEIHHSKHHQGYVTNLNTVLEKNPQWQGKKLENLMKNFKKLRGSKKDKIALKNNGGGHLNHTLFWEIMGPKKELDDKLIKEVVKTFGSIEKFKEIFSQTAISHFGSGWAWLVRDQKGKLKVYSLPNQDSPYLLGHNPIIGLDVWEHAYYLKYQNKRADYVHNWWNVLKVI